MRPCSQPHFCLKPRGYDLLGSSACRTPPRLRQNPGPPISVQDLRFPGVVPTRGGELQLPPGSLPSHLPCVPSCHGRALGHRGGARRFPWLLRFCPLHRATYLDHLHDLPGQEREGW